VGSDATDSDAGANGVTDVITVGASQMVSNVDASLQPLIGRVEGRVSLDDDFDQTEANTNTDDNNNPLDEGVQGVTVELLNDNGDVVATTTTDANGGYSFDVAAGTYQVRFEGVDDHVFAQQDVGGDDAIDSDASGRGLTDQITVQGGKTTANVDASVQQNIGYIEGRVTLDDDEDNTETNSVLDDNSDPLDQGIANQTVYLLDDQGNEIASTTTDATGAYAFAVVPGDYQVRFEAGDNQRFADQNVGGDDAVDSDPNGRGLTDPISVGVGQTVDDVDASLIDETPVVGTATVKGRVFRDDNHDSLDNGEDGIGDIEVALYAADGTLVATTTTEGDGSYKFENVVAGDYYVDFNENDPDAGGRVLVTKDVDGNVSDNIDSDADQATGVTDVFSVADGQFIFNKDAGFEDPSNSSISGRYFEDSDFDGVDNGEAGLIGYDVQLLAEDGTVLRTTTTDVNGDYTFDNIDGGRYQVKFVKDDSDPREFTFRNANGDDGDDTNDSDADDNGLSPFIQVGINQDVSDVDAGLLPDPDGGIDGGPDFEDPLDGMMNQNPDDLDRGLNEEEEEDELDPMLG
jgi:protocatechuate 3,4-dioxygenase beta subunit